MIRFEINVIVEVGVAFQKRITIFPTSLVLKGFCETTTEAQNIFLELRKKRNKC